jgi:hypothetical protein
MYLDHAEYAYWMAFYNSVCSALQLAAALP